LSSSTRTGPRSTDGSAFIDYNSVENPSDSIDPNSYGLFMTEDDLRIGWYSYDLTITDGTYSYEVWRTDSPSGIARDSDSLRAVGEFTVRGGSEYRPSDIKVDLDISDDIERLERAIARANNAGRRTR
jgi:hypothetical protein